MSYAFCIAWCDPVFRFQSLAMMITFALVFKSKDQYSDTAFDY